MWTVAVRMVDRAELVWNVGFALGSEDHSACVLHFYICLSSTEMNMFYMEKR